MRRWGAASSTAANSASHDGELPGRPATLTRRVEASDPRLPT